MLYNRGVSAVKWLPVVGFEELYEVSEFGTVRSLPRVTRIGHGKTRILSGREIKPYRLKRSGHVAINLVPKEGAKYIRRTYAHHLVLEAFVGPRPEGMYGCHNDGDPSNNHVSNLRWDSPSENMHDRVRHGNHPYADRELCNYGHPLDGVWFHADGTFKQRYCKTCNRKRARAHEKKKRAA